MGAEYATASEQGLPHVYAEMHVSGPIPLLPFHGIPKAKKVVWGVWLGKDSTLISLTLMITAR